ncbi:hypothetical protein FUAX_28620 [Fulvitalea axinellae]|uniref:Uncharacterized protein n=1 Tax=Fulvitalea axinellae TaxID=1182444 RepID=A0AAU9CM61_9BACT|nr:hypothetical protein FUAX_28620 [Fulvitalea axinellae]
MPRKLVSKQGKWKRNSKRKKPDSVVESGFLCSNHSAIFNDCATKPQKQPFVNTLMNKPSGVRYLAVIFAGGDSGKGKWRSAVFRFGLHGFTDISYENETVLFLRPYFYASGLRQ